MIRSLLPLAFIAAVASPVLAQGADFHWEKALPPGNEVSIHNVNGDVKVVPSTSGKVEIVGIKRGSDADRLRTDVHETSHGIVVCVLYDNDDSYCDDRGMQSRNRGGRRNNSWNDGRINLEIKVPSNLTVSTNTVSGDIDVTGAQGDVRVNSVSGDIRLDRVHASSMRANTVSGDMDVSVDELTGRGDLSFHTVSGDVTLTLPKNFDADLSMGTVSGDLESDFPITLGNGRMSRRRMEARIGNGGRRLDLATVSGDVQLRIKR